MRILILGSGAGGGVPQWNAPNSNGRAAFGRDPLVPFRSQCSIAVSVAGDEWAIVNATPDLRQQIIANRQLHPRGTTRSSPIRAVLTTGAEIDQIGGLLTLRERQALDLYASGPTLAALRMNPIFDALHADHVRRIVIADAVPVEPVQGLLVTPIDIPGKAPLYLEQTRANPLQHEPGDCFAYCIEAAGKRLVFAPGCAAMTDRLRSACNGADLVLFDGTLHYDDEMIRAGEGVKTGRRMGHMPMTGDGGTIGAFADIRAGRKMFIHVNNTNPAARLDSPERAALAAAGWDVAEDGMEIRL